MPCKAIYAIPTWARTSDLIAEHQALAAALGGTPSHWACYRFGRKLRKERERIAGCIDALAAGLREHYPDMGQAVVIDASDMPAYANGQRFLYNGGPERQVYSDPDASWGHRSAVSTRKGGGFYGYRIHAAVCTKTGLPLAWQVETARSHESNYVAPLLDATPRSRLPARAVRDGHGLRQQPYLRQVRRPRRDRRDPPPPQQRPPRVQHPSRKRGVEAPLPRSLRRRARVRPLEAPLRAGDAPGQGHRACPAAR